ncbi:hypothetical protein E4K24_000362 [Enterococcus faecium]|nr:hypothetical protein [Enterococcus faecium]
MFDEVADNAVLNQLKQNNYKIEYDNNCKSNRCAIYFSSHGIYYPETLENFSNVIVKKDYYEWYKTRVSGCHKHIFLRDIIKQFYVEGINANLNSIEKVIEFLKKETVGYEVICVGSSAGGYMAVIVGIALEAKKIYSFSGKFSLRDDFAYDSKVKLLTHQNDEYYSRYYNVLSMIESYSGEIVYVYPTESEEDLIQLALVKDRENIIKVPFAEKAHGVCMYPFCLKKFFDLSIDDVKSLLIEKEELNKVQFSFELLGVKTLVYLLKYYYKKISVKILKYNIVHRGK